jgi:hypothetical protein
MRGEEFSGDFVQVNSVSRCRLRGKGDDEE